MRKLIHKFLMSKSQLSLTLQFVQILTGYA